MTGSKHALFAFFMCVILTGCAVKNQNTQSGIDSAGTKKEITETRKSLDEIEEQIEGLDYQKVIDSNSSRIPKGFTITKFKYFVIISELPPEVTYSIIDNEIRHTIDGVEDSYTRKNPAEPIPFFLFSDFDEYKNFSLKYYGINDNDLSPYGYYKTSKKVIVVRFARWKGSISHEITHALIHPDFPNIPSWFDEGLASLHEQFTYRDGELIGVFSWRIVSLRRALEDSTYTTLNKLMSTNDEELYGKRSPFYYAQARYLLMYLQQKRLLRKYYSEFRDNFKRDETGIKQLEKITGERIGVIDKELVDYIRSFDNQ